MLGQDSATVATRVTLFSISVAFTSAAELPGLKERLFRWCGGP